MTWKEKMDEATKKTKGRGEALAVYQTRATTTWYVLYKDNLIVTG